MKRKRHRVGKSRRTHRSSGGATRFRFTLANGRTVAGPVQGAGGVVSDLERMKRAIRLAKEGRDTGLYEPHPGHVVVFPEFSAEGDGPRVAVDLAKVRSVAKVRS